MENAVKRIAHWQTLAVLGATVVCLSCTDQPTDVARKVDGPRNTVVGSGRWRVRTIADELADEIPSFGGIFLENGVLNVLVTNDRDLSAVSAALVPKFARAKRRMRSVRGIHAEFSYAILRSFSEEMSPILEATPGVTALWIDQRENRINVGVAAPNVRGAVESAMARQGVPLAMVRIKLYRHSKRPLGAI
jgi:hypothetical protein